MIVNKITEYTIFESPDGGETIYARLPGSNDRIKIKETNHVREVRQDMEEAQLWNDIRRETKTNEALREAMARVILLYHLTKDNNVKRT
jgi:HD superfamily phosphodiesterase